MALSLKGGKAMGKLEGKFGLVIGGTARDGYSSIGAAIAHFLAEEGAIVFPTSRTREKVQATVQSLERIRPYPKPLDLNILSFDARDEGALTACCDWIEDRFGPIDILVNAQGILFRHNAETTPREVWEDTITVNLISMARACQIVGKRMIERGRGHIINIASETSLLAVPYVAAYGTSKGGVRSLTAHLACEWARYGLCVNAIVPGVIPTDLNRAVLESEPERKNRFLQATPAGRFGVYEDLREATVFLATCTNYVNGICLPVDGGMSVTVFGAY